MAAKQSVKKKKPTKTKKTKSVVKQKDEVRSVWSSFRRNIKILRGYYRAISLITIIYGMMYFIFVRVLTNVDINQLKESVTVVFGNGHESFYTQLVSVGSLFGESLRFDSQSGSMYIFMSLISSLALIWVLRGIWSEKKVSVKEAYYQGMYPMVPFMLVILFILIQAIPFSISSFLLQTSINNGLAISLFEKIGFISLFVIGLLTSAYWIVGSIIAMFAVTVPGVTPSEARKTAKKVLAGRRFLVIRQILLFSILSAVIGLMPMMLIIWLVPSLAVIMAAILIVALLPWTHIYLYGLYRDLISG